MLKTRNQIINRAIETNGYDRNKSVAWAHSNWVTHCFFPRGNWHCHLVSARSLSSLSGGRGRIVFAHDLFTCNLQRSLHFLPSPTNSHFHSRDDRKSSAISISPPIQRSPLPKGQNIRRRLEMIVPLILFRRLFRKSHLRTPEVEMSWSGGKIDAARGGGCSHESAPCVVLDYGCRYAFEGFFHS